MAKQNLVMSSDHYEEIHKKLAEGEPGASVHRWLLRTYNENISTRTLNRYKAKYITIADEAIAIVNERKAIERKSESVHKKVEAVQNIESHDNAVANATAEQIQGLLEVGSNYPESVRKMREDAEDPNSKTEWKDVAAEERKAIATWCNFIKTQDTNVEVNVHNYLDGFVDESEVLRFINESESTEQNSK